MLGGGKVIVEYPEKVPINNGMVEFEIITVFPRKLDVALIEVQGLGEYFREMVYDSDTSIILVDYVNPPPGLHEFKLNVYRTDTVVYSHKFYVEFMNDPLGMVYAVAEHLGKGYRVFMDIEAVSPPFELFIDASLYHASSYYDKVLEKEEKIDEKGFHRIELGVFDLGKYSLEIVLISIKDDLEWRRIIVLPEIS